MLKRQATLAADDSFRTVQSRLLKEIGIALDLPRPGIYWDILDYEEELGLCLLHYNIEEIALIHDDPSLTLSQREALLNLQGVIYDFKKSQIVARAYGYTPLVTANQLDSTLTDITGRKRTVDLKTCQFQMNLEGVLLVRYKLDGIGYISTQKRIVTTNSRFGDSLPFPKLYEKLGGPADDVLFNPDLPSSSYCHVFLIWDPQLFWASKAPEKTGRVIYLTSHSFGEPLPEDVKWTEKWRQETKMVEAVIPEGEKLPHFPEVEDAKLFLAPKLTLDQANYFLQCGFSKIEDWKNIDYRLHPGEAIIVIPEKGSYLKVASNAYQWRSTLLPNSFNPFLQFMELTNYARLTGPPTFSPSSPLPIIFTGEAKTYSFDKLFPLIGDPQDDDWKKLECSPVALSSIPKIKKEVDFDLRLKNIALSFYMAVPIRLQEEAATYYHRLINGREMVYNYVSGNFLSLQNLFRDRKKLEENKVFYRRGGLTPAGVTLKKLINGASPSLPPPSSRGRGGREGISLGSKAYFPLAKEKLRQLLAVESGDNLYKLIQAVTKLKAKK